MAAESSSDVGSTRGPGLTSGTIRGARDVSETQMVRSVLEPKSLVQEDEVSEGMEGSTCGP
ncbi:hypothetical protein DPMN_164440 [Dreissena polymorpha]|uniref:Uncharacterized protein n=1 Tax=Dreissena polymorpha TaxID=45954 RepID=A0A9D4IW41_DREPO|nr:hypothetical protein DPMN_164440 [Dreissena polymorpha]